MINTHDNDLFILLGLETVAKPFSAHVVDKLFIFTALIAVIEHNGREVFSWLSCLHFCWKVKNSQFRKVVTNNYDQQNEIHINYWFTTSTFKYDMYANIVCKVLKSFPMHAIIKFVCKFIFIGLK